MQAGGWVTAPPFAWPKAQADRSCTGPAKIPYSNTNGSPRANSALTMMTEPKPTERKG